MFSHGDLVKLVQATGANDHNGDLRVWSTKTTFRVLHPTKNGEVVVVDDGRGLRVTFEERRLELVRRAEHTNDKGR